MKRILITLLQSLACFIFIQAQTQQGFVKTLGRPNQKGVALSGVSVRVQGAHNAILSKNDGRFSMLIQGDSYALQQVQKSGYELNETGIIGRKYAYSSTVPLTIVMTSKKQLQADKQRIEDNAYLVAERNYKVRMEQLESAKAKSEITIEQYRRQIQDLQDKFEKYQSMIDGLADHYARTDYDDLDEKECEINISIENGDIEHADSLLQQLGIQKRIAAIEQQLKNGQNLMDKANEDWTALLRQQEKDAEHLYQLYTISLARFDNQQAKYYIETRAALDTTNVRWQIQAFEFLCDYLADYELASTYVKRAFALSISQNGENCSGTAECMNLLGTLYFYLGKYDDALECYERALELQKRLSDMPTSELVESYLCMGNIYATKSEFSFGTSQFHQEKEFRSLMQTYYRKALDICYNMEDHIHNVFAECLYCNAYANMTEGRRNNFQKDKKETFDSLMSTAQDYYLRAIKEWEVDKNANLGRIATCYLSIGNIPYENLNFTGAIDYMTNALDLYTQIYGDLHPMVATCIHSLGSVYASQGNLEKALGFYKKAYLIRLQILGETHPSTQNSQKEIARSEAMLNSALPDSLSSGNIYMAYYNNHDYAKAQKSFSTALRVLMAHETDNSQQIADLYYTMGQIDAAEDDYPTGLRHCEKAIDIWEKTKGKTGANLAMAYYSVGLFCFAIKNYHKALNNYKLAYDIWEEDEDTQNLDFAAICESLGQTYVMLKDYETAVESYAEAYVIREEILGKDNEEALRTKATMEAIINMEVKKALKQNK